MEQLERALDRIYPLPQPARAAFLAAWKNAAFPKGHLLLPEGKVCHHIYFVDRGLVRIFYHKGKNEITEWLTMDGRFFFSITSFFQRAPSRLIIQLLEPSVILTIHHDTLMQLCREHHEVERLFRLMLTNSLLLSQERVDSLQFETARQRYQKLLTAHPGIVQRVPLAYIASFLGITQETLSRIRAAH
ncbi:MAG TPA: Crp/Fnr family transcriptional regulator [Saprospiraceae bacterium]|nr:Crp/Fnr family transcriptional regulator [Saprospiraceae bacterium]HNM24720.1 Crp/Fnr family transcriptional regulator [Saprospiraceae bacterium]